jgi:hypothetical protein
LKSAFGTGSSAFVDASLAQVIAAAGLPSSGISDIAVNAALALIESAKPQDELDCALAVQWPAPMLWQAKVTPQQINGLVHDKAHDGLRRHPVRVSPLRSL